jgi:hypothetical protein
MRRLVLSFGVALGVLLGVAISISPPAGASRNSSGAYSLPTGNPVVSGTTITSTWANNTLSDLGVEVTNSLDRNGRGAMVAPLKLSDGTSSAPALTFANELSAGLYRAGTNDIRLQAGTASQQWTPSSVVLSVSSVPVQTWSLSSAIIGSATTSMSAANISNGLTVSRLSTGAGIIATAGTSGDGSGIVATANGIGFGGEFRGGSSGGVGAVGYGTGTLQGVAGIGGTSGGAGGVFTNGIASTATTYRDALTASNGALAFGNSLPNPNSTVAFSNRLTPANTPKAWGNLGTTGSGGCVVNGGFNVSSCSITGANIRVTLASAMANTAYAPILSTFNASDAPQLVFGSFTTTTFDIQSSTGVSYATTSRVLTFMVMGLQ